MPFFEARQIPALQLQCGLKFLQKDWKQEFYSSPLLPFYTKKGELRVLGLPRWCWLLKLPLFLDYPLKYVCKSDVKVQSGACYCRVNECVTRPSHNDCIKGEVVATFHENMECTGSFSSNDNPICIVTDLSAGLVERPRDASFCLCVQDCIYVAAPGKGKGERKRQ